MRSTYKIHLGICVCRYACNQDIHCINGVQMHLFEQSVSQASLLLLFLEDLEWGVFFATRGVSVFACGAAVFLQRAFLGRDLRDAASALQCYPGRRWRVRLGRVWA